MGQPGHPVISHLGLSNLWTSPTGSKKNSFSLLRLTKIVWEVIPFFFLFSIVRIFHPFYFLLLPYVLTRRSLPHSITMESVFRFYRFKYISNPSKNLSRNLMLRVGYPKLAISSVIFLKLNTSFFIFFSFQDYRNLARSVLLLSEVGHATRFSSSGYTFKGFSLASDIDLLFSFSF